MSHYTCLARRAALAACLLPLSAFAQYSTPMRDVENPDRSPYMESGSMQIDLNFQNNFIQLPTPPGKRYVIENVNLSCASPSTSDSFPQAYLSVLKMTTSSSSVGYTLSLSPLVRTGPGAFGGAVWTSHTILKAYSDANGFNPDGSGAVYVNIFHSDFTARPSCRATVTGHTITP
ncbi:hypothetical protein [Roseateles puraquae]|uniref:Tat pathway signal sequence domain protein n=1 Tax=Roseateles puraquae TaxID=431059 RepID=A0A254N654_9BURK|nr:hypothetical protein [Roseateles puraquae]MDG0854047.1 hypothetical protein [Roseateles puraquae]OWR03511.1 hypothetical protein CDO81_13520 [Roseateles puraquae]